MENQSYSINDFFRVCKLHANPDLYIDIHYDLSYSHIPYIFKKLSIPPAQDFATLRNGNLTGIIPLAVTLLQIKCTSVIALLIESIIRIL